MPTLALLLSLLAAPAPLAIHARVDGGPARPGWVFVRAGQRVELTAVAPKLAIAHSRWFRLEPTAPWLDNTTPSFHFEQVPYQRSELTDCRDRPSCPVNVAPTVLTVAKALEGLGTMAFALEVTLADGRTLSTPGLESTDVGGLSPQVFRVAVRRDDTALGYSTELVNTPYIFGSAGPDGRNQSDRLIGSDCADLVIYGRRRAGKGAAYTSSYAIDQQAPERARAASLGEGGRALDARGRPIAIGEGKGAARVGDVLHFPGSRHVGMLWEDHPPLGVLDSSDTLLHTCWAQPTVEALGATRCASLPWRVLRFRD